MRAMLLSAVALVMLATPLLASPTLVVSKAGYYLMEDSASGPVLTKVPNVINLGVAPPTTGGGGDVPPQADAITLKAKGWAVEAADPTGAQALVIVYKEVAKNAPGQDRNKVFQALRQASDSVLQATNSLDKWKTFRTNVSNLIDQQEAAGNNDYQAILNSVAAGLEQSSPAGALDPALLQMIIQLVLQIIQLFFGGGLGGGGV